MKESYLSPPPSFLLDLFWIPHPDSPTMLRASATCDQNIRYPRRAISGPHSKPHSSSTLSTAPVPHRDSRRLTTRRGGWIHLHILWVSAKRMWEVPRWQRLRVARARASRFCSSACCGGGAWQRRRRCQQQQQPCMIPRAPSPDVSKSTQATLLPAAPQPPASAPSTRLASAGAAPWLR